MGPDALGRLIDTHGPALVLLARQWCPAAAEDVVQDAFLKLATADPTPTRPVPWLFTVVRNGAMMAARAERRRRTHESRAIRTTPWFAPTDTAGLDAEQATAALQTLPPDQRDAIVAHLWGGLTFDDVGELMGLSAATAYRRYTAGLATLRDVLRVSCTVSNSTMIRRCGPSSSPSPG
jgi:RNA polymerase sigma-70 factor (ECF subfamily)